MIQINMFCLMFQIFLTSNRANATRVLDELNFDEYTKDFKGGSADLRMKNNLIAQLNIEIQEALVVEIFSSLLLIRTLISSLGSSSCHLHRA